MIVENPYSTQHFLVRYFPIKSKVVHKDRTLYGDYYKKPTQYWFVNCEPKHNFFLENLQTSDEFIKTINNIHNKVERSLISKTYANRFLREFVISGWKKCLIEYVDLIQTWNYTTFSKKSLYGSRKWLRGEIREWIDWKISKLKQLAR